MLFSQIMKKLKKKISEYVTDLILIVGLDHLDGSHNVTEHISESTETPKSHMKNPYVHDSVSKGRVPDFIVLKA